MNTERQWFIQTGNWCWNVTHALTHWHYFWFLFNRSIYFPGITPRLGWIPQRSSEVEACTGFGLTGIPQLLWDSRRFAFIHCGNPAGLGLMSRKSCEYGMGCLQESHSVELKFLADLCVIASDKEANKKAATATLCHWRRAPVESNVPYSHLKMLSKSCPVTSVRLCILW